MNSIVKSLILVLFALFSTRDTIAQIVVIADIYPNYVSMNNRSLSKEAVKSLAEVRASKTIGGNVRRHYQTIGVQGSSIVNHRGNGNYLANQKVSPMFAIASSNLSTEAINWAEASGWVESANNELSGVSSSVATGCRFYNVPASVPGVWRLPTDRELMIIATHRGQLAKVAAAAGIPFEKIVDGVYISATEESADKVPGLYLGEVVPFPALFTWKVVAKSKGGLVRCIRDLP